MKRDWNYRRHHALRKQRHAYRVITQCWGTFRMTEDEIRLMSRRLRDNLAVCSCHMCRNPRRSKWTKGEEKLTFQERRSSNKENEY